ncbi:MAG: hypothetical protein COT80_00935 [Candidatus Buchananbacteria bacterium CG10_big_fil_rev_8_21_14_0_10_33_19]|uniref:Uncharacterized protein n=1 Tax=Candidatus Buchananbacteria bacterium CG10_big_fil_rev_8_21_14_0_10_33_19 TaxID=1974525 RepID=A0A2H0W567_9BACT|nr:MAG: hypothetical protein COT80_00935 [Candidatus Buchananbacteria bacterium CG10_big_fil_rev_8_21_14_0_10_33_19]
MKKVVKKVKRTKHFPLQILIHIHRDRRFKNYFSSFKFKSSDVVNSEVVYGSKPFTLYRTKDGYLCIFLNENRKFFNICEKCQSPGGITTIGGCYCTTCRDRAGNCLLCKRNRIDCFC